VITDATILEAVRPRMRRLVAEEGGAGLALLQKYTGTELTATIGGWLAEEAPPTYRLVRVWHLLEMMGCESPEMSELDELAIFVGRLYALGILKMEDLTARMGNVRQQAVLNFLRGAGSMKLSRKDLPALRKEFAAALAEAMRGLPRLEAAAAEQSQEPAELELSSLVDGSDPALALAILVGMAAPLAQELVDGSPEARERFRRLAGQQQSASTLSLIVAQLDSLAGQQQPPPLLAVVAMLAALRTRAAFDEFQRTRQ
jgi:hypothetical protein